MDVVAEAKTKVEAHSGLREERSFCRICTGCCGVKLLIDENDQIVDIRGDHDNPMTRGYACYKGLQAAEAHHGPSRLRHALKRMPDGSYEKIPSEQALDEIARRMQAILDRDGANAIGHFIGNGSMTSTVNFAMQSSFLKALGSQQRFVTMTIDQSAKYVSFERLGGWAGGMQRFEDSDVVMLFGSNPAISHGTIGSLCVDPIKRIKDAKTRGLKMVVIDPRYTETARLADIHLQPMPGHDAAIAAAMLRLILAEGWEDKDFCNRFVGEARMTQLRAAIAPYAADVIEREAGLKPGDIRAAADVFARQSRMGLALTGTGPSMAPFSNAMQHMVDNINVICGRFPRAGEKVVAVDVISPPAELREQVIPAPRSWNAFPPSRIRGVGMLLGERLTGTLADEILTPGEGQIKCMIIDGGNPASVIPDQKKIVAALESLELLVTIDPCMTATARLSHYVLPPTLHYERADLPISFFGLSLWPVAYSQYAKPLIKPPAGSDLMENWYMYWGLARRLGKQINFDGLGDIDMVNAPTSEALIAMKASRAMVPLDEIRKYPSGHIFAHDYHVLPGLPEAVAKFDVMPEDVAAELRAERLSHAGNKRFPYLLTSRRMRDFFNGTGLQQQNLRQRNPINPACLHPDEMKALALEDGDEIEIESDNGVVKAIAQTDASLRAGIVSLSHAWGGLPEDACNWRNVGTAVNCLISDHRDVEAVNAMPRMSAIPVSIRRVVAGL